MTMSTIQDVTWIFRLAQEWYLTNPQEQIPISIWHKKCSEIPEMNFFSIRAGKFSIHGKGISIIPVLAAISLGLSHADILKTIKHHNLDIIDLTDCRFSDVTTESPEVHFSDKFKVGLSEWAVCNEIIQAVSLDDMTAIDFSSGMDTSNDNHELSIACLLSPNKIFWPVTKLSRILENVTEERQSSTEPTRIDTFSIKSLDLCEYSNDQVIELIRRSGNFLPGISTENGIFSSFFFSLFENMELRINPNLKRIAESINAIEDPEHYTALAEIILAELSAHDFYQGVTEGFNLYRWIEQHLDRIKYNLVYESIVLKLNSISIFFLGISKSLQAKEVRSDYLNNLLSEPEYLLSKLSKELSQLSPCCYRTPHFKALFLLFSGDFGPQRFDNIDLNNIVLRTMQALDAYKDSIHVDCIGAPITHKKRNAYEYVCLFIKSVAEHMDIDYGIFSELSSDSKTLLATNGFDIKKLPNLTTYDRGRVLVNELGL